MKRRFISLEFYQLQQSFINILGQFDQWQAGRFEASNGHPKMARIVLVDHFKINTLTHETPRDIRLTNSDGRSKKSLRAQGVAVLNSILDL